ncbi:MAG: hypothetical protein M3Z25_08725 [Actinomycetota bacterium]|nr:hypothetical protein [Actinomycetota bacterium]
MGVADELNRVFDAAENELFRLETLPSYDVPGEAKQTERYAAGELFPDPPQPTAWTEEIRSLVTSGKRMPHVRLITEPLNLYLCGAVEWFYTYHAAAGREIFILSPGSELAAEAERVGDYWMFDSTTVALMRYDQAGDFLGIDAVREPAEVAYYVELRDRLLAQAEPFQQWLAGWRQRAR